MTDARLLSGSALVDALQASRARTLAWTGDLTQAQWAVPQRPGVNPVAWELAHLAWFAELWVLRGPHRVDGHGAVQAGKPPVHAGPDALLNSSILPHARRWAVTLPTRERVLQMLDAQLQALVAAVPSGHDDAELYFHRLALFHEDMHGEAFAWLRAAMEYPPPRGAALGHHPARKSIFIPGGEVHMGRLVGTRGFAFDNELPGRTASLADFEIDEGPVTAGQFLAFIEAGGYDNPQYWPGDAGRWRTGTARSHPERWRRRARSARSDTRWELRWFDQWQALDPAQPVIHVNAFEAEAYCRWAGRSLPTAAQWERAAGAAPMPGIAGSAPGFAWGGSVWEWTADVFAPYAGFVPGPYRDYSAPWFGTHRELRGGSFATHPRLLDSRYRNFFMPDRCDIFAGFRTTALCG